MSDPTRPEPHAWEASPASHPEPVPLISESDLVNPLLTVADVMTVGPRTCSPFSSVVEAAMVFRDADCGVIPIVDAEKPVGVLTDRDLALAVAAYSGDLSLATVGDLMTRDVVVIEPTATLQTAIDQLTRHGLRRLLVVGPDGTVQGILSWSDLPRHVSERALGHVVAQLVKNR